MHLASTEESADRYYSLAVKHQMRAGNGNLGYSPHPVKLHQIISLFFFSFTTSDPESPQKAVVGNNKTLYPSPVQYSPLD